MQHIDEEKILAAIERGIRAGISDLIDEGGILASIQEGTRLALEANASEAVYDGVKMALDIPLPSKYEILNALQDGTAQALRP